MLDLKSLPSAQVILTSPGDGIPRSSTEVLVNRSCPAASWARSIIALQASDELMLPAEASYTPSYPGTLRMGHLASIFSWWSKYSWGMFSLDMISAAPGMEPSTVSPVSVSP